MIYPLDIERRINQLMTHFYQWVDHYPLSTLVLYISQVRELEEQLQYLWGRNR